MRQYPIPLSNLSVLSALTPRGKELSFPEKSRREIIPVHGIVQYACSLPLGNVTIPTIWILIINLFQNAIHKSGKVIARVLHDSVLHDVRRWSPS